jgi:hypothetical protein
MPVPDSVAARYARRRRPSCPAKSDEAGRSPLQLRLVAQPSGLTNRPPHSWRNTKAWNNAKPQRGQAATNAEANHGRHEVLGEDKSHPQITQISQMGKLCKRWLFLTGKTGRREGRRAPQEPRHDFVKVRFPSLRLPCAILRVFGTPAGCPRSPKQLWVARGWGGGGEARGWMGLAAGRKKRNNRNLGSTKKGVAPGG